MAELNVHVVTSLNEAESFRREANLVHAECSRPDVFSTLGFCLHTARNDEYHPGGDFEPQLYLCHEGSRLLGYLPLRLTRARRFGFHPSRLEFLVPHFGDRPHLVARPGDEDRVAEAMMDVILSRNQPWSVLTLHQQDEQSALRRAAIARSPRWRFWPLEIPLTPASVIPAAERFTTFQSYLDALQADFRSDVRRGLRKLLKAGRVEYLVAEGPSVMPALLPIYIALENRSWKRDPGTKAGITRDPVRVQLFEGWARGENGARPGAGFVLIDGKAVAAMLYSVGEQDSSGLEMVFDDEWAQVSPGTLLVPMTVLRMIEARKRSVGMMHSYGYYKSRWLGESIPMTTLKLFRLGTPESLRAIAGKLYRLARERLREPGEEEKVVHNPARRQVATGELPPMTPLPDLEPLRAGNDLVRRYDAAELSKLFGLSKQGKETESRK